MLFVVSIQYLHLFWLLLATTTLAQRDCEKDGATSTYNQSGLVVSFDNLCGRGIEAPLDFFKSAEPRRSDCLERCVKQVPLCYGFDYTPYISSSKKNCYLMNGTFPASNATERGFIADAAMLSPAFVAQLPQNCRELGLRGCFEQNGNLGSSTSSPAIPTATSSMQETATSITPSETATGSGISQGNSGGGLSTGAKAGIGAGVGLVALIAILSGLLVILKRLKHKRSTADNLVPSAEVEQLDGGDTYSHHKGQSQAYAQLETTSSERADPNAANPVADVGQVHEIDGCPRHEK